MNCKPRSQSLSEGLVLDNLCFIQTLPIHFMKAQRTKVIPKCVVLRIKPVSHMWWKLCLSNSPSCGPFNFTFTAAWIQFVTHNRIVCGDILVFSKLTANMSKIQVYVFDYEGLPVTRRLRSDLMHALRTEIKVSQQSKTTKNPWEWYVGESICFGIHVQHILHCSRVCFLVKNLVLWLVT